MIQHNGKTFLSASEACNILHRSMEALRQLVYRNRLKKYKIGNRIYLEQNEVMNFFSNKMNLPAFESLTDELAHETFYGFDHVRGLLNYTPAYLKLLIKRGKIAAYCTADGEIMIPKSSLDTYLGVFNEADDL